MYQPTPEMLQRLHVTFSYQPPHGDQAQRYEQLRDGARELALLIAHATPYSREQSLALTHLEEVVMFANAAIARNES